MSAPCRFEFCVETPQCIFRRVECQHPVDELIPVTVTHELKTWPEYYEAVEQGAKTFEIRNADRGYRVGDVLHLREFSPSTGYTGRSLARRVTYLIDLTEILPGLARERYVALALGPT